MPSLTCRGEGHQTPRHPVTFVLIAVLAPATWVALTASSSPHELVVGGISSALTVAFFIFVCRSSNLDLALRPLDLMQMWRIPAYVAVDAYEITLVLAKDLMKQERARSLYRVCRFVTCADDPRLKARAVLATVFTTASPNTIVLGIDESRSRMLFHQIRGTEVSKMTKELGATL